jgi:hypothetical protein
MGECEALDACFSTEDLKSILQVPDEFVVKSRFSEDNEDLGCHGLTT